MSSTNRSTKRHIADYYVTPQEQIKLFLDNFIDDENVNLSELLILDPCCGGSKTQQASYVNVLKTNYNVMSENLDTCDIRADSLADKKCDYLEYQAKKYQLIITNPPFLLASDFIKKAIKDTEENGYVIMLLRLNFFGSIKRKKLFESYMPRYCYVHHKRMSFTSDNKTDSIEYAHFVWHVGNYSKFTKLAVI